MKFVFDSRPSDSPFVETIWRTQSEGGSFISSASSNMEMVVTKQKNAISFTVRGPETKASPAPVPEDAEIFGIQFKLGTFMPYLPASELVDEGINLPEAASQSFWLHGSAWQFPNFDNTDTFVDRLVRQGLLAHEPIVEAALQEQLNRCCRLPWLHQPRWLDEPAAEYLLKELSARSVQRRFLRATGLTHKTMFQIERAQYAVTLLQQGVSILDTVEQAGYYDQPHMTRSLKHFIGQTPAEILRSDRSA